MIQRHGTVDWQRYRTEFPVTERHIYFNNAAISPLSTRVCNAIQEVSEALARDGILCEKQIFGRMEEIRGMVATFVGADPDEIAFIKNTSQGINQVAGGIHWQSGDNVVMPGNEFPANVYPWMALARRGVELRMIPPDGNKVTASMLQRACNDRTRVVTVSHVQFSTGYRIDLKSLGLFCRERGIYLHVDGIQALGALQCDVRKLEIDFLSCGGHKWLCATPGLGFFYCRKELLDEIDVVNPGWTGVVNPMEFLSYDLSYRNEAARFEEGALNLHGIFALGASVERFLEIGMDRIEDRILSLTTLLERGLIERGYTLTSPRSEGEVSGIICFAHPGSDTEALQETLTDAGVISSLRNGTIRLSPHFYNNEAEVARVLEILSR
ncbi:MAG: aminotransferase class V-fold PLP-dependent enzyme [bacterium]|nr:MAG: aminotransferase class V-fold PLP-dependent enzyme [bacterium]